MHTRVGGAERAVASVLFFAVLAGGAVALLAGGRLDDLLGGRQPALTLTIALSEAHGVKRGTSVLIAGVEAGVVRDVEIVAAPAGGARVEAQLSVDGRYRGLLRRGTIARLVRPPLLGETTIDLLPSADEAAPLAPGDRVAAVAPERPEQELAATVRDLREAARALADARGTAGMLLADDGRIYRQVEEAVKRTTEAAGRLESAAADVSKAARGIPPLISEARDAAREASRVVGAAKKSIFIRGNLEEDAPDPREVEVRPRVAGN
jgi:ABC-type transporter Mla subunit MlaD